jgi:hypothetical protein
MAHPPPRSPPPPRGQPYDDAVKALCALRPGSVRRWLGVPVAGDPHIDSTWKESAMPFPSLLQRTHDEAFEEGLQKAAAAMLRRRFGPDDRIPEVARLLAPLGPDDYLARIEDAESLDELTGQD